MSYMMIHDPQIRLANVFGKKWRFAVGHLIKHRTHTPPICFQAVTLVVVVQIIMHITPVLHF